MEADKFGSKVDEVVAHAGQAEVAQAAAKLQELEGVPVTTELLQTSQAGRKVKKLVKHSSAEVAAAAQKLVAAWKDVVKQEAVAQAAANGSATNGNNKRQLEGDEPSSGIKRQKSGSGTEALTKDGSAPLSAEEVEAAKKELDMPDLGNKVRNKSVEKVLEGLLIARDEVPDADPVKVSVEVEKALFLDKGGVTADYKSKLLSLAFNLKDKNNPDLRRKVLAGEITGHILVTLKPEELASDARRQENKEIKEHAMWEAAPAAQKQATTDAFKCGKCKQKKCTYYQMQTRSADEPMTTFVTCTVCNNRWKFWMAAMMHCKCRRLDGHGAIVTGAGCSQIGRAIALRLAQEGSEVVLADIDGPAAEEAAAEIQQATSSTCTGVQVDMSNEGQVAAMVAAARSSLPQLSIFVNNAAVFVLKSVTEASEADWDKCLGCNVKGYAFGMKHAARAMISNREHGSIINVASISAWIAQPGFVPYSSSKGAVMQMTRCSAVDLAQHNIRVNAVCPGPILTEGTQRHADSQGVSLEAACQDMIGRMVMPRMGRPEEVASCVAFLASSDASFMTGSAMTCDGGYSLE